MKEKIKNINELLIKRFGIPERKKNLPDSVDMIIATILSQNTNDVNSYKAFKNLKNKYDSWEQLLSANRRTIESVIRIAGLGFQKSKTIQNFVNELYQDQGTISLKYISRMADLEAIEELTKHKGIGVKTASCVLLFAEGRNVCPVDTHVHRISNRIGIVVTSSPDKTYRALNNEFPPKIAHSFHTNLIRLGREICKPKNPNCSNCPLIKICDYSEKNYSDSKSGAERKFMLLDSI